MKLEELRQAWKETVTRYEASGKKQSEWCRENGINARNLNQWYNKFKKEDALTPTIQNWVPVRIVSDGTPTVV